MSGGAHHNPHGRQGQPNSAWNHLQVPNYFPRQPQLAHLSSDRPLSLSPLTWHTPTTTEPPTKNAPGPLYNLQQMMLVEPRPVQQNALDNISLAARDRLESLGIGLNRQTSLEAIQSFSRHATALPSAGLGSVDLTLSRSIPSPHSLSCSPSMIRNGQNGEASGPISLSVRDTKQINSMDTAELSKLQTGMISTGSGINPRSGSPKSPKQFKRTSKKMDSVLERLNSAPADLCSTSRQSPGMLIIPTSEESTGQTIGHEQRLQSPSSISITTMSGTPNIHFDESMETVDKLRHKRKPDKTTRIDKEDKVNDISDPILTLGRSANLSISELSNLQRTSQDEIPQNIDQIQSHGPLKSVNLEYNDKKTMEPVETSINKQSNNPTEPIVIPDSVHTSTTDVQDLTQTPSTVQIIEKDKKELISEVLDPLQSDISSNIVQNTILTTNKLDITDINQSNTKSDPICSLKPQVLPNNIINNDTELLPVQTKKRRSSNEESHSISCKVRRKTCSESETIDNIAAMIASGDDAAVIVPIENINSDNNSIKDSQILAHVLADPIQEDCDKAQEQKDLNYDLTCNNKDTLQLDGKDITKTSDISPDISNCMPSKAPKSKILDVLDDNSHTTNFVQVENELEKMFAGIEEPNATEEQELNEGAQNLRDNVTSTSSENKPKRKLSNNSTRTSRKSSECSENSPKKKNPMDNMTTNKKPQLPSRLKVVKNKSGKGQNMQKNAKLKTKLDPNMKDVLTYDSGSNASSNRSRGPFVQIKGPRDSPISVSIVNTSTNDDDAENRTKYPKTKKHHEDAEFRHKMRKGLHSSTLSMKYDATTTDVTWVCVFCKNGPHCGGTNSGDLFGPYLVTTTCPEFQYSQQNPEDDPFKSKRTKQDMMSRNLANANTNKQTVKRKRVSQSETTGVSDLDIYAGMVEASPGAYEVWGHEECIIWAPGVYLVGSRVIGLEGAIWSSCRAKCSLCNLTGANVGCSQRGCDKYAHISCAARNDWHILEDEYKATCPDHHST